MSIIEEIKNRVDLLDYVQRAHELRRKGSYWQGLCPLPGHDERTGSFTVYPDEQRFHCYGCKRKGDIIDYVKEREGLSTEEAIENLCAEFGIKKKGSGKPGVVKGKSRARKMVNEYLHKKLYENKEVLKYLKGSKRGLDDDDIKRMEIGVGTGDVYRTFKGKIADDVLEQIGIAKKNEESKKYYDYIPQDVITVPVYDEKNRISHWDLKFWRNPDDTYQLKNEHREGALFYNVLDLIDNNECFIVESVWEVNQLVKRGYKACAILGSISEKQIKFISELREKNPYFPEMKTKKVLNIWLDRDKLKDGQIIGGQLAVKKIADKLHAIHKVVIWKCPEQGQDPDEFLRHGGSIDHIEREIVHHRMNSVEMMDDGFVIHGKDEIFQLTDFKMRYMYRYRDHRDDMVRTVALSRNGDRPMLRDIDATALQKGSNFIKWLCASGNYNYYGSEKQFGSLREYLNYTDTSKEILVTPHYGNIEPGLWLYDNGCIVNGKIIRADDTGVTWVHHAGIEGIKASQSEDASSEHKKIAIPDEWFTVNEIVRKMLFFYPPEMVRIMLGFATACIFRKDIARYFGCFPILLLFGDSTHGKTVFCELLQSLMGASGVPSDSCTSTGKAFMAHVSRYHSFPMMMSEYNDAFIAIMKNIFDLILYSKKRMTIQDETYDPVVNAPVVLTTEITPTGKSVLNRCCIINFNEFVYEKDPADYDAWIAEMKDEGKGFGFLYEVLNSGMGPEVMDTVNKVRRQITNQKWGMNSRLIYTLGVVYGCFSILQRKLNLKPLFKEIEDEISKASMLNEMHVYLQKAQDLTDEQDMLELFFEIMQILYLKGNIDDFVHALPSSDLPDQIRFQVSSVLNEILAYDRRNRNYLSGVKRSDIEHRICTQFGVEKEAETNSFTLDLKAINEDYGISFKKMKEQEKVGDDF